jgi:hypothetical protein
MLKIMARNENNEVMTCFVWTRSEFSGIARAWADAKVHGVKLLEVWAVPA